MGIEGYYKTNMNIIERSLLIVSGLLLFAPTDLTIDLISIVIIIAALLIHRRRANKTRTPNQKM
jgi:TRAP-type uncharacterized transport system fused permease subunit